jgi:hypothetical protein
MDACIVEKSIRTFIGSENITNISPTPQEDELEENVSKDFISSEFSKGNIVFKIVSISLKDGSIEDDKMVNTNEDYEKKLYTHLYQPLLFSIDLPLRLSYLYGCLNFTFNKPQNKEYIFMWREIRTNCWNKWFKIKIYKDDLYKEIPIIEYFCKINHP